MTHTGAENEVEGVEPTEAEDEFIDLDETNDEEGTGGRQTLVEDPIAVIAAERDELKDRLLRTAADFENFKKRALKERQELQVKAREDVLREILPVIDNLERAVQAADKAPDAKAVADGVMMVLKYFEDVASRLGLERLASIGQRFDPSQHDALQQLESADHEPGTVMAEILAGYRFRDRLLRAASVVVARAPEAPPPATEDANDEGAEESAADDEGEG